jgi:2-oxoacid:acceptor oxidoreductase gamma subunit (pyruvate/2-ketoisovalerate family)
MMQLTIQGRGGHGGVTLAKLIAAAYFLRGKYVQAFGAYGAERAGAPVQAYVRVDDDDITDHWPVREPDHVIVLEPGLISAEMARGMGAQGWLMLNTPSAPDEFADFFAGRHVATIDATAIAVANGLGTEALPIVNSAMLGAAANVLGLPFPDVEAALAHVGLAKPKLRAARAAYQGVHRADLPGTIAVPDAPRTPLRAASIFDEELSGPPTIRTGGWATHHPTGVSLTPFCTDACPADNDVRGFVQAAARGDPDAALKTILATSPFPGVCGRVCPAPCMAACARGRHDEAVNSRELERYVAAHARWPKPTQPARRGARRGCAAVIGGGPAGLSAAYHLARLGHPVTVYEGSDGLGGLLRTGIPEYRLPRAVLDREIAFILAHGVHVRCGTRISPSQLQSLRTRFRMKAAVS